MISEVLLILSTNYSYITEIQDLYRRPGPVNKDFYFNFTIVKVLTKTGLDGIMDGIADPSPRPLEPTKPGVALKYPFRMNIAMLKQCNIQRNTSLLRPFFALE